MLGLWSEFMRFISEIQNKKAESGQPVLSVEFFPPKTDKGMETLFEQTLTDLDKLDLDFCSVTYGAGGSTTDKTLDTEFGQVMSSLWSNRTNPTQLNRN